MRLWITIFSLIYAGLAEANNLEIGELDAQSAYSLTCSVEWEHSWNLSPLDTPANHDAVWLFAKGLKDGNWKHLNIDSIIIRSPFYLEGVIAINGRGAIIRRSMPGEGDIESQLEIYLQQAISQFDAIRLMGVEMVYIPEGGFFLGDGASNNSLIAASDSQSLFIASESTISIGQSGELWDLDGSLPTASLARGFPKGFKAFYSMKYEISQDQWVDFLNTIDEPQQLANELSTLAVSPCFGNDHTEGERNFIRRVNGVYGCDANDNGVLNESDDGGTVACNFLTWDQLAAYLDWTGLRPMTELEFEKASRGPEPVLDGAYAWGNTQVVNTDSIGNEWTEIEYVIGELPPGTGLANYGYCLPSGPLRVGFAAQPESDRIGSGASYFGLMEMSGNVWEQCIPITETTLDFDGRHGDGRLAADGLADVANWTRSGLRGGGWNSGIVAGFKDLAISDRFYVYLDPDDFARGTIGGRGVLSADQLVE